GPGGPVAEAPGIGERVAIRVRRAAAVEAHGRALGAGVRSPGQCGGWVIDATGGVMAAAAARIGEGLAGYGSELPGIGVRVERELQDSPRHPVAHLAVGDRGRGRVAVQARAARAHDELTHAVGLVEHGAWVLRRESLVAVFVAVHDYLGAVLVQRIPQRLICRVAGDDGAGDEARSVPVSEGAELGVGREVGAQPLHLRRTRRDVDLAVDGEDVPGAQVVAVVPFRRIARGRAEVSEVPRRVRRCVLVVARYRPGAGL